MTLIYPRDSINDGVWDFVASPGFEPKITWHTQS